MQMCKRLRCNVGVIGVIGDNFRAYRGRIGVIGVNMRGLIQGSYTGYVRRTSLRYVSILFFIHLYLKINKDWVMVLDSSGQEAQDFNKI